MLNVVRFLEKLGSDAQWDEISMDQMELALAEADIEGAARSAILNKDVAQLQALMQQKLFNPIIVPGTEEDEEEEEGVDEPGEKDMRLSRSSSAAPQA
jgi:pSer/pThr/pTyr-binding forkhead associated (FHA) protein